MVHASTRVLDNVAPSSRRGPLPPPRLPVPTPEDDAFMRALADDTDDTEESPWLMVGELQAWSTSSFAYALRIYAGNTGRPWYVASMLPIVYPWPLPVHLRTFEPDAEDAAAAEGRKLAPDTMVAFDVDEAEARTSFSLVREGRFPPFVLEVVSPTSKERDEVDKRRAYDLLGAEEYAVFTPQRGRPSTLTGWRRGESGRFEAWAADEQGALWSTVLELFLVVRGERVMARTAEGVDLLTPEESDRERRRAEEERQRAEEGRRRAEAEVERLRAEIARLRRPDDV